MALQFFYLNCSFQLLYPKKTSLWIKHVIKEEKAIFRTINCVFCSDSTLLELNKKHLKHNTYTDILTFNYASPSSQKILEGDLFISIDRVIDNAKIYKTSFKQELHRVIIHGILHLLGFEDKTKYEKLIMRKKEELYLSLLP